MDTTELYFHPDQNSIECEDKGTFYKDAANYWSQIPPTIDGMLGGFGFISGVDIHGSSQFLNRLFRLRVPPGKSRALDCGAGIGRITKDLLVYHFQKVDLVEQNPAFVAQARASLEAHEKTGKFLCSGLQDFTPESGAYDVIWCQWVLGHLTDKDLISFLSGCLHGLKENGVIVLKENVTNTGKVEVDSTDSSVTRPLQLLCELLEKAGLRRVKQRRQDNLPHGLYPVYMIATRPMQRRAAVESSLSSAAQRGPPTGETVDVTPPEPPVSTDVSSAEPDQSNDLGGAQGDSEETVLKEALHTTLDRVELTDERDIASHHAPDGVEGDDQPINSGTGDQCGSEPESNNIPTTASDFDGTN